MSIIPVERYPFLTLEQAAFFLQVPVAEAERLHEVGELPKAASQGEREFEPTPGRTLIPYQEFRGLLSTQARSYLSLWQNGHFEDVPTPASKWSPARPFNDARLARVGISDAPHITRLGD